MDVQCPKCRFKFNYPDVGAQGVVTCMCPRCGEPFEMHCGNWKGVRTGIYCYGSQGKAQFDFFKYDIIR